MPQVHVVKKFTLAETGKTYDVGVHNIPDEYADHWFVRAHGPQPETAEPNGQALDERTGKIEALRSAEVQLRATQDQVRHNEPINAALKNALEASEAKVAELQKALDELRQTDAAKTHEYVTQAHTAHSGASSQELLPNNPAHPESDEVLKARAEAERKGLSGPQMGKGETQDDDKGEDDKPGNGRNTLRLPRASTKD